MRPVLRKRVMNRPSVATMKNVSKGNVPLMITATNPHLLTQYAKHPMEKVTQSRVRTTRTAPKT